MFHSILSFVFLCGLVAAPLSAVANSDEPDTANTQTLAAYPYIFYTPETKIAFGGGGSYAWHYTGEDSDLSPNSILVALTYTQQKQFIAAITPEIYTKNRKWLLNGFLGFYHYPDKYWGIGNNTPDSAEEDFEPRFWDVDALAQHLIIEGLMAGLVWKFTDYQPGEILEGGLLDQDDVLGSGGSTSSGLGLVATYDTRRPRFSSRSGYFLQMQTVLFRKAFGSTYHFNRTIVDMRHFLPLGNSMVLAVQGFGQFTHGEVPFNMLPFLGGKYSMRGYYFGRFRDNYLLAGQAEFRYPIWNRFRGVVFAGVGSTAPEMGQFTLKDLKPSVGLGLRFVLDPQDNIVLRLDIGFGEDGNNGLYIMINEAF